jgi:hypothetical protein
VYAQTNLVDARMWMRRVRRDAHMDGKCPFLVLGRVTLYDAISTRQTPWGFNNGLLDAGLAMRANRARIEELFIFEDADLPHGCVPVIQAVLSKAWGVPVRVGEPDYTAQEWAAKQFRNGMYEEMGLFSPSSAA